MFNKTEKQLIKRCKTMLQGVPGDEWIEGKFTNEESKCCAIGHIQRLNRDPNNYYVENCADTEGSVGRQMRKLSTRFLNGQANIASVNNYKGNGYYQNTPKERVMALLNDMLRPSKST